MISDSSEHSYRVVVSNRVPASLRESAARLGRESFDTAPISDEQRDELRDRFCSDGDIHCYVLAVEDDEAIGMVIAYRRNLVNEGSPLVLGGVGSVCVAAARRRLGIASRLMTAAMRALGEASCDVAYLCTDIKEPSMLSLYGRFGFVPLGRPHTFVGASGTRYVDDDAMLAPVCSPDVFKTLLRQEKPLDIGRGNW